MKNPLRHKRFQLALALLAAFALGFIARALDIRIDLDSWFAEVLPWSEEAKGECVIIEGEEICYGPVQYGYDQHDRKMLQRLMNKGLPEHPPLGPDYTSVLSGAIGLGSFLPRPGADNISLGDATPYEGGTLREVKISFDYPPIWGRALYARHSEAARDVIVILHGLASSAEKVMGLDKIDYHRAMGLKYFKRGFDVIAFDVTTDAPAGSRLTSRLMFYGTTTHGVAVRSVCDLRDYLVKRGKYERIFLYGLSNGGTVAHYATALCGSFSAVIADHGLPNWRKSIWQNSAKLYADLKYPLFILYRHPYFRSVSPNAFFAFSNSPLFVVQSERETDEIRDLLERDFDIGRRIDPASRVNIVNKTTNFHMPEITGVIDKILAGDFAGLSGGALTPKRDFSKAAGAANPAP